MTTKRLLAVQTRDLTEGEFAPFGRVLGILEAQTATHAAVIWKPRAQQSLASAVLDVRQGALGADRLEFEKVEVHHRSHQLTVAFGGSWIAAVMKKDMRYSDSVLGAGLLAFDVPPRVGVLIHAGVWHAAVASTTALEVVTFFKPGTIPDESSVRDIAERVKLLPRQRIG